MLARQVAHPAQIQFRFDLKELVQAAANDPVSLRALTSSVKRRFAVPLDFFTSN